MRGSASGHPRKKEKEGEAADSPAGYVSEQRRRKGKKKTHNPTESILKGKKKAPFHVPGSANDRKRKSPIKGEIEEETSPP